MRPHVFLTVLQLRRHIFQIHIVLIPEQTVAAKAFHSRTGSDVLRIDIALLSVRPVILQSLCDERGGVDLGRAVMVLAVLRELFCTRKIFYQTGDELLLLFRGRTSIRDEFCPFTCADVLCVIDRPCAALNVRTFENQPDHLSSVSSAERTFCSKDSRPFVPLTLRTLSVLRRRISSSVSS